jgi:hypothetical protein
LREAFDNVSISSSPGSRTLTPELPDDFDSLILDIGNTHKEIPAKEIWGHTSSNKHDWTFFVSPSQPEIVQEVVIFLVRYVFPLPLI